MTRPNSQLVGHRIRSARLAAGWTQRKLANCCALSVTFISEIENGHRSPGLGSFSVIARALGETMDYLAWGAPADAPERRQPDHGLEALQVLQEIRERLSVVDGTDPEALRDAIWWAIEGGPS